MNSSDMDDYFADSPGVSVVETAPLCDLPRNLLDSGGLGLPQARRWSTEMASQYSEMIRLYHMDASGLIIVSGEGDWMSFVEQGIEESWTGGYQCVAQSKNHCAHLPQRSLILEARIWREWLSKDLLLEIKQRYSVARNIMLIPDTLALETLLRRSFTESYLDGVNSAILEARRNQRACSTEKLTMRKDFRPEKRAFGGEVVIKRRAAVA